jgi:cellobiose phosphorylase
MKKLVPLIFVAALCIGNSFSVKACYANFDHTNACVVIPSGSLAWIGMQFMSGILGIQHQKSQLVVWRFCLPRVFDGWNLLRHTLCKCGSRVGFRKRSRSQSALTVLGQHLKRVAEVL